MNNTRKYQTKYTSSIQNIKIRIIKLKFYSPLKIFTDAILFIEEFVKNYKFGYTRFDPTSKRPFETKKRSQNDRTVNIKCLKPGKNAN